MLVCLQGQHLNVYLKGLSRPRRKSNMTSGLLQKGNVQGHALRRVTLTTDENARPGGLLDVENTWTSTWDRSQKFQTVTCQASNFDSVYPVVRKVNGRSESMAGRRLLGEEGIPPVALALQVYTSMASFSVYKRTCLPLSQVTICSSPTHTSSHHQHSHLTTQPTATTTPCRRPCNSPSPRCF
jgi:hypothetical protein